MGMTDSRFKGYVGFLLMALRGVRENAAPKRDSSEWA